MQLRVADANNATIIMSECTRWVLLMSLDVLVTKKITKAKNKDVSNSISLHQLLSKKTNNKLVQQMENNILTFQWTSCSKKNLARKTTNILIYNLRWICIFNVLCKFILWMYLYLHLIPLCWSESWPPNSGSLRYSQKTLWIYLYLINFINIFVYVNIFIFGRLCEYICIWSILYIYLYLWIYLCLILLCIMASQFWHPPLFTEGINRLCLPLSLLCAIFIFMDFLGKSLGFAYIEYY